jgi:hypothetical protein
MSAHDAIVIGTRVAGASVAAERAAAGREILVRDGLPHGGTWKQRGCDPKKILLAASDALSRTQAPAGQGLAGDARIVWSESIRRKPSFVADVPERTETGLRDADPHEGRPPADGSPHPGPARRQDHPSPRAGGATRSHLRRRPRCPLRLSDLDV